MNSQRTNRSFSASGPMREVQRGGIGVRQFGNADFDRDGGQHTTTSDRFEVKSGVGELSSSHIMLVLMRHIWTGHVPYYSWGFHKRWKWGNATRASCYRLRSDKHHHGTETVKTAWCSGRTGIRHNSTPQCPCKGSGERQSKNGIHGSVYGAIITGSRIGGDSCAHAGLQLGFGIALVPVQASWSQLTERSTFGSTNPSGSGSSGSGPGRPSWMPREFTRIYC